MAVVEDELDRVMADGLDGDDDHPAFAAHRALLRGGVSLHFGAGTRDAQVFGGQVEGRVVVGDAEDPATVLETELIRPIARRHAVFPALPAKSVATFTLDIVA